MAGLHLHFTLSWFDSNTLRRNPILACLTSGLSWPWTSLQVSSKTVSQAVTQGSSTGVNEKLNVEVLSLAQLPWWWTGPNPTFCDT